MYIYVYNTTNQLDIYIYILIYVYVYITLSCTHLACHGNPKPIACVTMNLAWEVFGPSAIS